MFSIKETMWKIVLLSRYFLCTLNIIVFILFFHYFHFIGFVIQYIIFFFLRLLQRLKGIQCKKLYIYVVCVIPLWQLIFILPTL